MKHITSIFIMLLTTMMLSACQNTVSGLNKDIDRNSDAVNKAIHS